MTLSREYDTVQRPALCACCFVAATNDERCPECEVWRETKHARDAEIEALKIQQRAEDIEHLGYHDSLDRWRSHPGPRYTLEELLREVDAELRAHRRQTRSDLARFRQRLLRSRGR